MARLKKHLFLLPFLTLSGCSIQTIAARQTAKVLDRGAASFLDEPDPELAREAMASNLKLFEALLACDPGNRRLLLRAAEGFNGYSFLYLEDAQPERAKGLYLRGRDFALKLVERNPKLASLPAKDLDGAAAALKAAGPQDVPALFWAAFGWGAWINLSKDNPAAVADLPKVVAVMQRVSDLDPSFHFAGPDLFFGMYYASRPAIAGGDTAKAKTYFESARARTSGKFLMTYVLEARYLAVASQDQELFKALLSKVAESEAGVLPESRLTDAVAKKKAAALLEKINDYF